MITNRDRNSFESRRKNSISCSEEWHRWRFWSAFRHFGTQFAESFRKSISLWMMDPTRSREMPSCSAIDVAEILQDYFIHKTSWGFFLCSTPPTKGAIDQSHQVKISYQGVMSNKDTNNNSGLCSVSRTAVFTLSFRVCLWVLIRPNFQISQ
jgi:hypothetical protein